MSILPQEDKEAQAQAYHNRGLAKESLGKHKEATADYTKATKIYQEIVDEQRDKAKKEYTSKTCYKFRPINKDTIEMLVNDEVYFSDVVSLNDPLECPLLEKDPLLKKTFQGDYQPRILSLVIPPPDDKRDTNEIYKIAKNTLMFSHYADAHKGICIEYTIDKGFLEQGKMFYTDVEYSPDTSTKRIPHLFAIKKKDWEYEHEGRFVAFDKEKKIYKLDESSRITKIIFGLKTTDKDKALVKKLLASKKSTIEFVDITTTDNSDITSSSTRRLKAQASPFRPRPQ